MWLECNQGSGTKHTVSGYNCDSLRRLLARWQHEDEFFFTFIGTYEYKIIKAVFIIVVVPIYFINSYNVQVYSNNNIFNNI